MKGIAFMSFCSIHTRTYKARPLVEEKLTHARLPSLTLQIVAYEVTRFIGMWGTLPHITNERQPITFSSARLKCLDLSTMEHLLLGQSCGKSPVTPLVALACATQDLDLAKSLVLTSCSSEGPLTMLTRPDPFKKGISRRVT